MDKRNNPASALEQGARLLKIGDLQGYWKLMGRYDPYAELAADVQANRGVAGTVANRRLDQAFLATQGRLPTEEERQAIQAKIANADFLTRQANLKETGDLRVESQQTVRYHKKVFDEQRLPDGTYTPEYLQEVMGGAWSLYAGAPTKDISGNSFWKSYLEHKANDIKGFVSNPAHYLKNMGSAAGVLKDAGGALADEAEKRFLEWGEEKRHQILGPVPQQKDQREPRPDSDPDHRSETRQIPLWQQTERGDAKTELITPAENPEPPPSDVFTTVPWPNDGEDENTSFGMFFHQGGAVPADGDPRTEVRKAMVQEGEFVLAPVTTQAVDPDLMAAMNAMAAASPDKARKLRDALAAILGDGPPLSEAALKKRMAADRDYWRSGPEGDAKRWWYATEYRFAFPDDQDGRTSRQDGGLVSDGDWARRQDDLPAELPEGGFVFSRNAVRAFGANLLGRLNAAGLVENAPALTEVRRAIVQAMGRRLKLTTKELKALQMDPRAWRDLDRRYIDRIADEYRHSTGD